MQTLNELLDDRMITEGEQTFFMKNNIDVRLAEEMIDGELPLDCAMALATFTDFNYEAYTTHLEYQGQYYSLQDLAEEMVDEGCFGEIPDTFKHYINWERLAQDLSYEYVLIDYKYVFKKL